MRMLPPAIMEVQTSGGRKEVEERRRNDGKTKNVSGMLVISSPKTKRLFHFDLFHFYFEKYLKSKKRRINEFQS